MLVRLHSSLRDVLSNALHCAIKSVLHFHHQGVIPPNSTDSELVFCIFVHCLDCSIAEWPLLNVPVWLVVC